MQIWWISFLRFHFNITQALSCRHMVLRLLKIIFIYHVTRWEEKGNGLKNRFMMIFNVNLNVLWNYHTNPCGWTFCEIFAPLNLLNYLKSWISEKIDKSQKTFLISFLFTFWSSKVSRHGNNKFYFFMLHHRGEGHLV